MEELVPIRHEAPASPSQDFDLLKEEGIRYIQQLAGQTWTDHNGHDPGITILEQLCYALTDLGYRIGYSVPDLLASDGDPYKDLFSPAEILTGNALTLTDLRKLVLDVPGVKNAWIETVEMPFLYRRGEKELVLNDLRGDQLMLRGLYKVWLQIQDGETGSAVVQRVTIRLAANRTVCEDIFQVEVASKQEVRIRAVIEAGEVEDPALFLADIYHEVENYISPSVHFYTLAEMLEKGKPLEEIMEGPALLHGFVDGEDLSAFEKRSTLYASDIVRVIHQVPGVQAIRSLRFFSNNQWKDWKLDIVPGLVPDLVIDFSTDITLEKNGFELKVDADRVKWRFNERRRKEGKKLQTPVVLPPGRKREIGKYHSIQHHFPSAFALGEGELPGSADQRRIAVRQQLRAYLLIFDQVLANQFSQVAHLKNIFAFKNEGTYFAQMPASVPELKSLISDEEDYEILIRSDNGQDRKNRLLNHLMARFAEDFTHFSLLLPDDKEYGDSTYKTEFLENYPVVSGGRARGIDLLRTQVPGGLEKRILLKLGDGKTLFYVVEHVLLRPTREEWTAGIAFMKVNEAGDHTPDQDPFSFQMSYIFPAHRITDKAWIQYLLREETPAHIQIRLISLAAEEFGRFRLLYTQWRAQHALKAAHQKIRGLRNRIIDFIELGVTYPLSDLPVKVHNSIVPYGYRGKYTIAFSEPGVVYSLYRLFENGVEQQTSIKGNGNEGDLVLETEVLEQDSEFVVYGTKELRGSTLRTRLVKQIAFKIGIDKNLGATLVGEGSIPYSSMATVQIKKSQERVGYQLFDLKDNKALSGVVDGTNREISITTYPLQEDVTLVLKAFKTFILEEEEDPKKTKTGKDKATEQQKTETVEIGRFKVWVKPDINLETGAAAFVIPYNTKAEILVKGSQRSVEYQYLYRMFDENDIVYDNVEEEGLFTLNYPVENNTVRDLYVRSQGLSGLEASARTKGKAPADLKIVTPLLTTDHLFTIKGSKSREGITDDLEIGRRFLVLVQPRTDLVYEAPVGVAKDATASIVIQNPQRGVIYQLVTDPDQVPVGERVVFHKNKATEQARVSVDFVIDPYPEETVIVTTPPLEAAAAFRIKATQLYTGVSVVIGKTISINILP